MSALEQKQFSRTRSNMTATYYMWVVYAECQGAWSDQDCTEWQLGTDRSTIQFVAACKEDMSVKCSQEVI